MKTLKTNIYYRIICLIIFVVCGIEIIAFFSEYKEFSYVKFIVAVILLLVSFHQTFYNESYILLDDRLKYYKEFLFYRFRINEILYSSIITIEKRSTFQFRSTYKIRYYNRDQQISELLILINSIYGLRQRELVIKELSELSGKRIEKEFI